MHSTTTLEICWGTDRLLPKKTRTVQFLSVVVYSSPLPQLQVARPPTPFLSSACPSPSASLQWLSRKVCVQKLSLIQCRQLQPQRKRAYDPVKRVARTSVQRAAVMRERKQGAYRSGPKQLIGIRLNLRKKSGPASDTHHSHQLACCEDLSLGWVEGLSCRFCCSLIRCTRSRSE